jgi:hypothetical protein
LLPYQDQDDISCPKRIPKTLHVVQHFSILIFQSILLHLLQKFKRTWTPTWQAWLKAHPDITLGYTDAFEPEVIVGADGTYSDMLVDFLMH